MPDCVAPSLPIKPPCVPTILTGALLYETEVLISKNLPVMKAPKLEIIGTNPFRANPVAIPIPFASAIPTSIDFFGKNLVYLYMHELIYSI